MMEQMAEDSFFDLIGLDKMTEDLTKTAETPAKVQTDGNAGKSSSTKK